MNSAWQCADAPCPGSCDVWGHTHVKTFDGGLVDFNGSCEYVLAKAEGDPANDGWFQVVLQNSHCSVEVGNCHKSVVILFGLFIYDSILINIIYLINMYTVINIIEMIYSYGKCYKMYLALYIV